MSSQGGLALAGTGPWPLAAEVVPYILPSFRLCPFWWHLELLLPGMLGCGEPCFWGHLACSSPLVQGERDFLDGADLSARIFRVLLFPGNWLPGAEDLNLVQSPCWLE